MFELLIFSLIYFVWIPLSGYAAKQKGRSVVEGVLLGCLGPFGFMIEHRLPDGTFGSHSDSHVLRNGVSQPNQVKSVRQLVGLACVNCGEHIKCILDGQFCDSCGCPVHSNCIRPTGVEVGNRKCAVCGADEEHSLREQESHQEYQHREKVRLGSGGAQFLKRTAYGLGGVVMLALWVNSLVNPIPAGGTGNANYDTGDQVGGWFFSGLLAVGGVYCLFKAIRGRPGGNTAGRGQ